MIHCVSDSENTVSTGSQRITDTVDHVFNGVKFEKFYVR